jgi:hypothetical protein
MRRRLGERTVRVVGAAIAAVGLVLATAAPAHAVTDLGGVLRMRYQGTPYQLLPNQAIYTYWNNRTEYSFLILQTDGNLVLYHHNPNGSREACWSPNKYTTNPPSPKAVWQEDGNFVLYWGSTVKWASNTSVLDDPPRGYDSINSNLDNGTTINISRASGDLYIGYHREAQGC